MIYQRVPIQGHDGYEIDTNGNIFSKRRSKNWRQLKLGINPCGYSVVGLFNSGRPHWYTVHRLVAKHFVSNIENKSLVCHKDGNRLNNTVDNLYWGTYEENMVDRKRHGRGSGWIGPAGERSRTAKLNWHKVKLVRLLHEFFSWSNCRIARIFNMHPSTITACTTYKTWKT